MNCSLDWLSDPEVFEVNRLPAHSDHIVYSNIDELKIGKSSLYQSLNGKWKFSYAVNPDKRKSNFYADSFDTDSFDEITVPGHIELQGFGKPHYVNTMYPWEGKEHLRPPFVSKKDNPVGSYVKYFDLDDGLKGKRVHITFQQC